MGLFSSILKPLAQVVSPVAGAIFGGQDNKKAISAAAAAQTDAINRALGLQERQYDETSANLNPAIGSGNSALQMINELLGISTPATPGAVDWKAYVQGNPDALADYQKYHAGEDMAAYGQQHYAADGSRRDLTPFTTGGSAGGMGDQAGAIEALKDSPLYQSLFGNGRDAILAAGSATGGLRGGNINGSLANFGRDTLAQVIQQQLANLGGIQSAGQSAAGMLGGFGANSATQRAGLTTDAGNVAAGSILGRQAVQNNTISSLTGILSNAISGGAGGIDIASLLKKLSGGGGIGGTAGAATGGVNNIPGIIGGYGGGTFGANGQQVTF